MSRYYLAYARNLAREWRRRAGARVRRVVFVDNVCRRWQEWRRPVNEYDPLFPRMRALKKVKG